MNTKKYFTLSEENGVKTCLKLEAYYDKGGWNGLSCKEEKRGIWVMFTQVKRSNFYGYTTESVEAFANTNFKVFVKELGRKNDKRLEEYWGKVERNGDLLFGLWNEKEYHAAADFVMALAN